MTSPLIIISSSSPDIFLKCQDPYFNLNYVRTYKLSLVGQYVCIKVHCGFTLLKTVVPNSASSSLDPIVEYVCKDLHCGFTFLKTGFFSSASSSHSTEWELSIVNCQLPISRLRVSSPVPPPPLLIP